jgi:hypothetical protein
MGLWLMSTSIIYSLGTFWYKYCEKGKVKRVFIIPNEFWFALFGALLIALYITKIQDLFVFQASPERALLFISGVIGLFGLIIHAIAKYYDERCNIEHWSRRRKMIISLIHLEFSHYLVYLSICGVLFSLSAAEDNRKLILISDYPSTKVLLSSGTLFAFGFYRTILLGNTIPVETVILPVITGIIFKNADLAIRQTVFQFFSITALSLTSAALIYRNVLRNLIKTKII